MSERAGGALSERVYDVVVAGGGPVGVALAKGARAAALGVAIVEKELLGGECQYWACVPSKALLRPVVAIADACRVQGAREAVAGRLNTSAVFARRDGSVFQWHDDEVAALMKSMGAELVRGHGRLEGPRRVAVDGYRGRARMVVDHGYLLGVTFVGPGVAELLHSATVAVAGQVPIDRLRHAVPCFPSISEVWPYLLEAYQG